MFHGFEFIQAYIDNLFMISKGDWYDYMETLELPVQKIKDNGLKYNIKKSFFGQINMGYLVLWVTWNWIRTINRKEEAIVNMTPQNNTR